MQILALESKKGRFKLFEFVSLARDFSGLHLTNATFRKSFAKSVIMSGIIDVKILIISSFRLKFLRKFSNGIKTHSLF